MALPLSIKQTNILQEASPEPSEAAKMHYGTASRQVSTLLHAPFCGLTYSESLGLQNGALIVPPLQGLF